MIRVEDNKYCPVPLIVLLVRLATTSPSLVVSVLPTTVPRPINRISSNAL